MITLTQQAALKLVKGDTSYTFLIPDSDYHARELVVIIQDSYGKIEATSYPYHKVRDQFKEFGDKIMEFFDTIRKPSNKQS